jgi:nucleotide-binding universal stress UspA family protein
MAPQSATGSIVVGTDGSETAKLAVREAVRLAKAFGEEVHVVSGYTPLRGARIAGAPEGAAKVWAPLPDSEVSAILDEAALLQVASDTGANLIVIGNRGMQGARRLLGSVPNKVSHQAPCNVLIVATDES